MPEQWETKLRVLRRMEPSSGLLEKAKEGSRHPRPGSSPGSRIAIASVALLVFGIVAAFAWAAFTPGQSKSTVVLAPGEIDRITLSGPPQGIAVGEGAVWVQVGGLDEPFVLWRIDAVTGEAKPLRGTEELSHPAVGAGFVWAVCEEEFPECRGNWLLKLGADSGRILARVRLPGYPSQPQIGLGAVWVPTREGVVEVDPDRMAILRVLPGDYRQIGIAGGFLWATTYDHGPDHLLRLDAETGGVLTRIDIHGDACILEASEDAIWVATCRSEPPFFKRKEFLMKLDPSSGEVLVEVPIEASGEMRVVGESLWMAYFTDTEPYNIEVVGFDLTSGEPSGQQFALSRNDDRFIGPGRGGPLGPNVAADDHSLWISEFYAGEVIRLGLPAVPNEVTNEPTPSISALPSPTPSEDANRSSPSPSPSPRDPNEQLVYRVIEFARSPNRKTFSAIPLAKDGVWLGLGPRLVAKRSLEELSKPTGWVLDAEEYFEAYVGTVSAVELLAERREVRVSAGPHPHCASPPVRPPKKFAELDRLSVQPREWGSCLQWFTVDFFVSADGTIQAVTLDLWEP